MRLRHSTIKPVFGSLIQHYGLRKIGVRGKAGAHKLMVLAACAFNLKKYLKFKPVKVISQAIALEEGQKYAFINRLFTFSSMLFLNYERTIYAVIGSGCEISQDQNRVVQGNGIATVYGRLF